MKPIFTFLIAAFTYVCSFQVAAQNVDDYVDDETLARNALKAQVITHLSSGTSADFDALNALFRSARDLKQRTPSGTANLFWLYAGIDHLTLKSRKDQVELAKLYTHLDAWTKHSPNDPSPYLARVHADILIAKTLPSTMTNGLAFKKNLVFGASQILTEHEELLKASPYYYTEKLKLDEIRVDRWSKDEVMALYAQFRDSAKIAPANLSLYITMLKAFPEPFNIESFAREGVKNTQAEEGLSMYARVYWSYFQMYGVRMIRAQHLELDWNDMKTGMRDVLKRYPNDWNAQFFAFLSCLKEDRKTTREMFEYSSDKFIDNRRGFSAKHLELCRAWSMEEPEEKQEQPGSSGI